MNIAAWFRLWGICALWPSAVLAQFTISGVTDKASPYADSVTFTINIQANYSYNATLNWNPIATGTPVVVNKPDFYELRVDATNQTTSAVTSQYVRFIVRASERGGTEWGLPPHVPFPAIQSSPSEFVGARLRVLTPTTFPTGYEIPVVAWVVDDDNHAVRANGVLTAAGQNPIQLKRGVGSGFLSSNQPAGLLSSMLSVDGISTNKLIVLQGGTVWTNVSGTLSGITTWPAQSRMRVTDHLAIPTGSSLTIGAGAIVLLNSGVNITNNGAVVINGSVEEPVIFMPNSRAQPWGGFFMRTSSGSLSATGAIFIASGANPTGGAGHRPEQCLLLVDNAPTISLSDSAAIFLAGQLGHAYSGGTFTFTRFLMQRATTGGEYTGANFTVNDSAFIECPDDTVNFVDGDNDALYLVSGNHFFTNTLLGWTKDDGIDSGGDGLARLHYEKCWFESVFHEGNSLSGLKNTTAYRTVYLDCGQGIEDGYGPGSSAFGPTGRVELCFFGANQSGVRHGDNYESIGNGYPGFMTATNCISIYNHRNLFGFNWRSSGWTNAYGQFFVSNNFVSVLDTNYPNNTLWNPATDGWRLSSVGGVARVGVGFGARGTSLSQFPDGIPVGLSRHCTNEVAVDYDIDGTDGTHTAGTLLFPAGLTRRFIPAPTNMNGVLRIALLNPQNADVTGKPVLLFQQLAAATNAAPPVVLSSLGGSWTYLDNGSEQGAAWRGTNFDDSAWSNGVARLGFADDISFTTTIRKFVQVNGVNTTRQITNAYFRRSIVVTNPTDFATLQFRYQRDDGCIVYVNSNEVFRSNMPGDPITANTFASANISPNTTSLRFLTNNAAASFLRPGTNVIAVQVHQSGATSSDVVWDLELQALPAPVAPAPPRVNLSRLGTDAVLYWNDATFGLEEADLVTGPWRPAMQTNSPSASAISSNRFFRLVK
ncbi:MAG TPA: hypothetical protein VK846_10405 [Candidatus Limnocylindria bacterium]|nr:hypothetical protein [Candidatus Limnocylindria bacterium]